MSYIYIYIEKKNNDKKKEREKKIIIRERIEIEERRETRDVSFIIITAVKSALLIIADVI